MRPKPPEIVNRKSEIARVVRFPIVDFRFAAVLAIAAFASACEPVGTVLTDFKKQPKLDPWETPADTIAMRANPQGSVPITGSAAPGFAYGRLASIAAIDSMKGIVNPVTSGPRSLNNGRMQYQINCAVCHGGLGMADGPVTKFGLPVLAIGSGSNAATKLSDGYIFGIIRNGRGLMPSYNRIEEGDRWDLINYLRAIQKDGAAAQGAPLGRPGQTGALLPGASFTAPTVPAPHARP
jgi:mono/diheme cytochrome c family protein